jgi:hypothetical protein
MQDAELSTGLRIEHQVLDGSRRRLATGTESTALASAISWVWHLRRQGKHGAVLIVSQATGQTIKVIPLDRGVGMDTL